MLDGYKVVCCTPAGRKRYMQLLVPQILSSSCVDRYDIWLNTTNEEDLTYLNSLGSNPKVNLVPQPDGKVNGNASINAFFRKAIEQKTIYIRFDDDVIWLEADAIERIARFRIENPDYFLVFPMIINNAVCTNILQNEKRIDLAKVVGPYCMDRVGWEDPFIAESLHRQFLTAIEEKALDRFRVGVFPVANARVSINCISWLGSDLAKFDGIIEGDEEEYLTTTLPQKLRKSSCIYGDVLIAHFAFYTQRDWLDRTDILYKYWKVIGRGDIPLIEEINRESAVESGVSAAQSTIQFPVPRLYFSVSWLSMTEIVRKINQRLRKNWFIQVFRRIGLGEA